MTTAKEFFVALRKVSARTGRMSHSPLDNVSLILAAIRGPDTGDSMDTFKTTYTAPIRLWAFGARRYSLMGYFPEQAQKVKRLTRGNIDSLIAKMRDGVDANRHYSAHITQALRAIKRIEGW